MKRVLRDSVIIGLSHVILHRFFKMYAPIESEATQLFVYGSLGHILLHILLRPRDALYSVNID